MFDKTIAAIATAQGSGGIGVIRISGDNAFCVADKVFKSISDKKAVNMQGYTASFGFATGDDGIPYEAVMLVFKEGKSFTGENVVELSCHGGLYVTKTVLRAVLSNGAVLAEPGEFTKRAFLNGKIDLLKAESIMNIISAKNKNAAKAANSVLAGVLSERINKVKDSLVTVAAHLSAWADYPEDEIPMVRVEDIEEAVCKGVSDLETLVKECDTGRLMCEGIDTAIVGRPNVGKSTLMNLLSGCDRSIVTDIPGTTRDIVEDTVILGDYTLHLSDTAGIRNTDNIVEQIGVDKAKKRIENSELIIAVFDGSQELSDDDREIINSLDSETSIAVINKSDLTNKIDREFISKNIRHTINISAKTGEGKEELINAIGDIFEIGDFNPSSGILMGERQRNAVVNALERLREAEETVKLGYTLDAVTVAIEFAIQELMELTGERAGKEIVDKVFANFCVGK